MRGKPTAHWFAAAPRSRSVSGQRARSYLPRRSLDDFYAFELIPLYRSPLQSSFATTTSPNAFRPLSITCLGFVPLRDMTRAHPPTRKLSTASLRSVPRFSQPPDGLLRAHACGLISSRCHVQGHPVQGILSSRSPILPRREAVPPCR